jgi:hypothetical protein
LFNYCLIQISTHYLLLKYKEKERRKNPWKTKTMTCTISLIE